MIRVSSDGVRYVPTYLPAVETLVLGEIPTHAFREYLAFKRDSNFQFERVPLNGGFERLRALEKSWSEEAERKRQERHIRGEFTLAERLARARDDVPPHS